MIIFKPLFIYGKFGIIVTTDMQYLERHYYLLFSQHFMFCIEEMSETVAKLYKVVVNGYQT